MIHLITILRNKFKTCLVIVL